MDRVPRILIVDDDEEVRLGLAAALSQDTYDLRMAANGEDALRRAVVMPPDVIILDQMMPDMPGVQVCAEIRKMRGLAEVPIVMVTPISDRNLRMAAFDAGADDVLSKPIDRLEIRMRIRNITRLNRYRSLMDSRGDVSRMLSQVRGAYDQTIAGWARALELRDEETKGHSERVTTWTVDLSLAIGIQGTEIENIRRGALLHDIGKMGIPDSVLLKPGPLDPDERTQMEQHPSFAYEMLSPVEYLKSSIPIPYCHHERWDGAGYPRGLAGEAIPYPARLFSVVDVFDALTSNRPYRKAWDIDRALGHLRSGAGTHFDPKVVMEFTKLVKAGGLTKPTQQQDKGLVAPWWV